MWRHSCFTWTIHHVSFCFIFPPGVHAMLYQRHVWIADVEDVEILTQKKDKRYVIVHFGQLMTIVDLVINKTLCVTKVTCRLLGCWSLWGNFLRIWRLSLPGVTILNGPNSRKTLKNWDCLCPCVQLSKSWFCFLFKLCLFFSDSQRNCWFQWR